MSPFSFLINHGQRITEVNLIVTFSSNYFRDHETFLHMFSECTLDFVYAVHTLINVHYVFHVDNGLVDENKGIW